jgi:hypothetical protein
MQELLNVVTSAKNKCLKSQWTIQITGRTINLRKCLTRVLDWVQKFAQVGNAAVRFDTTHAAVPWAGFRFLLQVTRCPHSNQYLESDLERREPSMRSSSTAECWKAWSVCRGSCRTLRPTNIYSGHTMPTILRPWSQETNLSSTWFLFTRQY